VEEGVLRGAFCQILSGQSFTVSATRPSRSIRQNMPGVVRSPTHPCTPPSLALPLPALLSPPSRGRGT